MRLQLRGHELASIQSAFISTTQDRVALMQAQADTYLKGIVGENDALLLPVDYLLQVFLSHGCVGHRTAAVGLASAFDSRAFPLYDEFQRQARFMNDSLVRGPSSSARCSKISSTVCCRAPPPPMHLLPVFQSGISLIGLFALVKSADRAAYEQHISNETGYPLSVTRIKDGLGQPSPNASMFLPASYSLLLTTSQSEPFLNVNYMDTL